MLMVQFGVRTRTSSAARANIGRIEQIVGRERRERVSQLDSFGDT
jgi:hypothetical protein